MTNLNSTRYRVWELGNLTLSPRRHGKLHNMPKGNYPSLKEIFILSFAGALYFTVVITILRLL